MNINVNHPTFISFLNQVTNTILSNISLENYFTLGSEKKVNTQYLVLKLLKNSIKLKAKFSDNEIKSFVNILRKKNEEMENYEFASVLNEISNNFEKINEITIPKKRTNKQIKIEKKD
jgi:hypothetical protein